jgi:hypothetical protein
MKNSDARTHRDHQVPNHHATLGPDLGAVPGGSYVAVYENELGEQWIFVREPSASTATLYGGDDLLAWEPVVVKERTPEELDKMLTSAGVRKTTLGVMASITEPLVPDLILDQKERAWLNLVWWTSERHGLDEAEDALRSVGERLARTMRTELVGLRKHPNSAEHRAASTALALAAGVEAGRRGLGAGDAATILSRAIGALNRG